MATILEQQTVTFYKLLIHGIIFCRSAAAFHRFFPSCKNKSRLVIFFTDSSCYDSCKTLMTIRQKYNHYSVIFQITAINQLVSSFCALFRQCLTAVIQCFQIVCKLCSLFFIFTLQKRQGAHGCIQSSAGINARTKAETNIVGTDFLIFQANCSYQSFQSLIFCMRQT